MIKNFCPSNGDCNREVRFKNVKIGSISKLNHGQYALYPLRSNHQIGSFRSYKEAELTLKVIAETIFNALDAKNI